MPNKLRKIGYITIFTCIASLPTLFTSCVDNDYDLSKDIDLNVTLGGNELTIPTSSTDAYTMAQILDIDPETSSIKAVESDGMYGLKKGDYVLQQNASPTESSVSIDVVSITHCDNSVKRTALEPFVPVPGVDEIIVNTGDIKCEPGMSDDNITHEILKASWAETDCDIMFNFRYESNNYNGTSILKKGFTVKFEESLVIDVIDPETKKFVKKINDHTIQLTTDKVFTGAEQELSVKIHINEIDLTKLPQGEGLYAPGKFKINSEIILNGDVAVKNKDLQNNTANINLVISADVVNAKLLAVKGIVDPKININPTSVTINDIPDFLSEPGNVLDIQNPQIYLNVNNTSDVQITLNAKLSSFSRAENGQTPFKLAEIGIGEKYNTQPIVIKPNGTTEICLSRTGNVTGSNCVNIKVESLGELIRTLPGRIEISDIEAIADKNRECTIRLNDAEHPNVYTFKSDYKAIVPLAFGPDLRLTYESEESEWNEDLEKYNFDRVNVSMNTINTIPLNIAPKIDAIDINGNVINNITATIEGDIKAGTLANATSSQIRAVLQSTAGNLKDLNGIIIRFEASSDENCAGTPLNQAQELRFNDIKISVTGGITIDLND